MKEGLILHPDNEHLIFPLGTTIVVRHIISRTQQFLRGHDNELSVIVVSNTGKYIASGQKTYQGFKVRRRAQLGHQALICVSVNLVYETYFYSSFHRLTLSSGTSIHLSLSTGSRCTKCSSRACHSLMTSSIWPRSAVKMMANLSSGR